MYAALPDTLRILIDTSSSRVMFFSKNTFFYVGVGVMVVLNIFLNILSERLAFVPAPFVMIPQKDFWLQDFKHRKDLSSLLQEWMKGICLFTNLFLLAVIAYIYSLNMEIYKVNSLWAIYLMPALMLGWKVWLLIYLNKAKNV
ncbi:MAG: hypothetical protein OHK0038_18840 [Flammeovirgaceae bacterium]